MNEQMPEQYKLEPKRGRSKNKLIGVVLFVIIIGVLATSFLFTWRPNLYSSPEWGFEVQFPAGWRKTNEGEVPTENFFGVTFQDTGGVALVGVYQFSEDVSLDNFVSTNKQKMQESYNQGGFGDYTILSENYREASDVQAWEMVITYTYQSVTMKSKSVFLVSGQFGYILSCNADSVERYSQLDSTFEAFIQSFRLI